MNAPPNVVPFNREPEPRPERNPPPPTILGKLRRKDFELWVCRGADGTLSLKWWRWKEDLGKFTPLEDGALTLDPAELRPLAEMLASVGELLQRRGQV
jgi:hypothetical protein